MTAAEYLQTLHQTRSKRLQELCATFGSMREAAREIGCYTPSYLTRLCRGIDPFNERIARNIESSFGLEFGALDRALEN